MSDEHPVEEPGPAAPAWAAVPTMPWERVPDQRPHRDLDNAPTSPPVDPHRYDDPRQRQPYDDGRGYPTSGPPAGYPAPPPPPRAQGRTYGTPSGPPASGYGEEANWDDTPPPPRRDAGRPGPPRQPQPPYRPGPPPPRRREDDWSRGDEWARSRRDEPRRDDRGRHDARRDDPRRDDPRRDGSWRDEGRRDDDRARGVEWSRDDERARADRGRSRGRDNEWPRDSDRGREGDWARDGERGRDNEWARDGDRGRDADLGRDSDRARHGERARDGDRGRDTDWGRDGDRGRDGERGRDAERGRDGEHARGRGGRDSQAWGEPDPWQEPGGRHTHPDAPTSGYPIQPAPGSAPPVPPAAGRGRPAGGVYGSAGPRDIGDEPTETTGELPRIEAADDPAAASPTSGTPFSVSPAGPTYTPAPLTRAGVDGLQATGYLPIVRPGAAGFPPELAAVAKTVRPPAEDEGEPAAAAEPEEPAPDPEQLLAAFEWRFDPDTLREQIEGDEVAQLEEIRDQLTAKLNGVADNPTRARLLSLRAVVSRILGDLLKAFADGKLALAHAEATGELRRIAIAQARLAGVLQWRGEFEEADRLLTLANSSELPDRLRATMHQHAGRCAYDQGRYMEACNHFERALDLRKEEDPELIAQTELALDAVFRRVAEKGWGPYPRSREETLQIRKPPAPAFDEATQRWGFTDAEFNFCIGPGYVDVQPFRDGVAWVQRQGSETWELIDDTGRSLIDPSAGYLGVSSFSDGLAWVSRDGTTRWIAIDKANTVLISTGFDDVRPFRRGVAAVRRGHRWGAVDGVGRMVVPFQFDGFATALHDGRYIDGFSDEGLAVVSLSGRKGVVDRSGRVIVPPVHHILMIHPVAFLVADEAQRWGALDRRGRMIIEQTFPSRMGVTDEIDRLLADTRPVI